MYCVLFCICTNVLSIVLFAENNIADKGAPATPTLKAIPGTPGSSSSGPLQPLKVNGTSTSFRTEERGDLIKFYNHVYVQHLKTFALRFRPTNQEINVSSVLLFSKAIVVIWL